MNYKICSKCEQEKPATAEYFHKQKNGKYGFTAECKICHNKRLKDRRIKYPDERRNTLLKYRYGITLEERTKMFEAQEGKCKYCGRHESELTRILDVDHDHDTDIVRGLLCHICNMRAGVIQEYKKDPIKWDKYLEEAKDVSI